jgi:signal peptidase I
MSEKLDKIIGKDKDQSWVSFVIEITILIMIVLFIRFYVFQFFRVSGPSMCPTLNFLNNKCSDGKGEFIFVNEFAYNFLRNPKRGEIIVFKAPHAPKGRDTYIKRVIGVEGDIIEVKDGRVYLTNKQFKDFPLPEIYLSELNKNRTKTYGISKFEVPAGKYLVFGDNRAKSADSRQCFSYRCHDDNSPFITKDMIIGEAKTVVWPFWKTSKKSGFRQLENPLSVIEPTLSKK